MKNHALDLLSESKSRVVRQNRFDLAGEKCTINVQGHSCDVIDCSSFGIAFKVDSKTPLKIENDQAIHSCGVFFEGNKINDVSIRVVRIDNSDSHTKIACEIIGQPLEVEKITGIQSAIKITNAHDADAIRHQAIPSEFRRLVSDMKVWLLSLKSKVDKIENEREFNRVNEKSDFENTIANVIGSYIVKTFEPLYVTLESVLKNQSAEIKNASFEYFREQMIDILLNAPFHNRAFNKPLGYAGDFQMMNQIYSFEGLGDSLFSKCLHLYFISAPESRAVRNRADYLYDQIVMAIKKKESKSQTVNILSVACGPAFEIQNYIKKNYKHLKNINFYLLDQDLEALQFTQKKIKMLERDFGVELNFEFIHKPIKHVIAKGLEYNNFDLIYSAGLFDYFTDPVAHMAAKRLYEALSDDGKLIIGNFSNSSLGKITMDIALDWHLIYRSPEELSGLFCNISKTFNIESEPEGINLFCHLNK